MTDAKTDFSKYVGKAVSKRFAELGLSQYRFVQCFRGVTHPTLRRILRGTPGSNINSVASVCDALGLEIIIRPKKDGIDYKKKFAN